MTKKIHPLLFYSERALALVLLYYTSVTHPCSKFCPLERCFLCLWVPWRSQDSNRWWGRLLLLTRVYQDRPKAVSFIWLMTTGLFRPSRRIRWPEVWEMGPRDMSQLFLSSLLRQGHGTLYCHSWGTSLFQSFQNFLALWCKNLRYKVCFLNWTLFRWLR